MILTVLGYAASVIAALGIIALGIAVAARVKLDFPDCQRSRLTLGALLLMILTVMCSELAAHGQNPEPSRTSLRRNTNHHHDWSLTLQQLKTLKAKIAKLEQLA